MHTRRQHSPQPAVQCSRASRQQGAHSSMHLDTAQQLVLFGVCLALFQYGFFTSRQRLPDTTPQPSAAARPTKRTSASLCSSSTRFTWTLSQTTPRPFRFCAASCPHEPLHDIPFSSPRRSFCLGAKNSSAVSGYGTFPTFIDFTRINSFAVVERG